MYTNPTFMLFMNEGKAQFLILGSCMKLRVNYHVAFVQRGFR